ncbi:hypothetical protein [Altibacter lentus]|uniref:hypothetical protein n=1 Tax=Altibacter lentus TaxID=1223410 RepID=UPI0005513202|nr:hypothetical protein [Altibacter lentus]
MENKREIGSFFEDKLREGEKSLESNLWERINNSLDVEKIRRKKILFYWATGVSVIALIGLLLLLIPDFFSEESGKYKENATPTKDQVESTLVQEHTAKEYNDINATLIENKNDDEGTSSSETQKDSTEKTHEISVPSLHRTNNRANLKNESIDETFTVSKKYYYYNSKDGRQIETNEKSVIDSLISKNNTSLDSIVNKGDDNKNP